MAALGLVAYGSDDDESIAGSDVAVGVAAGVVLLGEYADAAVRGDADSAAAAAKLDEAGGATPGEAMEVDPAEATAAAAQPTGAAPGDSPDAPLELDASGGLPPELANPPPSKCDPQLQEKVARFLSIQRQQGREIKTELRHSRGYRNPDFLQKMVDHLGINETGSCYPKDIFDPGVVHEEDYYEALRKAWDREQERRAQERQANGRIDFTSAGGKQPSSKPPSGLHGSSSDLHAAAVQRAKAAAQAVAAKAKGGSRWDNK